MASCEVINCQRMKIQCREKVAAIAIDKTDGIVVFLPTTSLGIVYSHIIWLPLILCYSDFTKIRLYLVWLINQCIFQWIIIRFFTTLLHILIFSHPPLFLELHFIRLWNCCLKELWNESILAWCEWRYDWKTNSRAIQTPH